MTMPRGAVGEGQDLAAAVQQLANRARQTNTAVWAVAHNTRGSLLNRAFLLGVALVALDSLVVAHYQPDVALTLIRTTAPVALLTGTLLNVLPLMVPAVVIWFLGRAAVRAAGEDVASALADGLTALAWCVLGYFVVPASIYPSASAWLAMASSAVLAVWGWLALRARRWKVAGVCASMLVVATGWTLSGMAPWLERGWGHGLGAVRAALAQPHVPAEELEWRSGADSAAPEVGYVLHVDSGWVTVLDERTRRVVILPSDRLAARQTCTLGTDVTAPRGAVLPAVEPRRCPG